MNLIAYELLDDFQKEAIEKIRCGYNVIVSAPTGTGKTAIIDHIIVEKIEKGENVIYTGPIKALCNQKFRDYSKLLGPEKTGLITGDEVVNEKAPMLIMTTEVLRNMLQENTIDKLPSIVIFDEIHYIADEERGHTWEESIVLLPAEVQIVGLSATVPNADELALWIETIKGRETTVIRHRERAVPLRIFGITKETGLLPFKKVRNFVERMRLKRNGFRAPSHLEIIGELEAKDMLPALYFLFNRKRVETFARELASVKNLLTNTEKREVRKFISSFVETLPDEVKPLVEKVKPLLIKGIGYHHAGLIPQVKRLVEMLFERKLLKVVYCTSTFALGINMPARTVCFDSIVKFDGKEFRPLKNIEFFQKAGRAGRRGIDKEGFVVVRFDPHDHEEIPIYDERDIEPIVSTFRLSYNSVINLIIREPKEKIYQFLNSSLWSFQHEEVKEEIKHEIKKLKRKLEEIPEFECSYDEDLLLFRKTELEQVIEREKKKLDTINRKIEQINVSDKKKKRLLEKRESIVSTLLVAEKNLKNLKLECCDFCINRKECRLATRKRRKIQAKIKELEERLKFIESYLVKSFEGKAKLLEELSYIDSNWNPKFPAEILRRLHIEELLVSELVLSGFFDNYDPVTIATVACCIGRDEDRIKGRSKTKILSKSIVQEVETVSNLIGELELKHIGYREHGKINWDIAQAAYLWALGEDIHEIAKATGYYEGDIISAIRQGVDLLRQLKRVFTEVKGFKETPGYDIIREAYRIMDRSILREFSP